MWLSDGVGKPEREKHDTRTGVGVYRKWRTNALSNLPASSFIVETRISRAFLISETILPALSRMLKQTEAVRGETRITSCVNVKT